MAHSSMAYSNLVSDRTYINPDFIVAPQLFRYLLQHFLYFLPLPQGQVSFGYTFLISLCNIKL